MWFRGQRRALIKGMLLTSRSEKIDALRVLEATRREVRFLLPTHETLRKPRPGQSGWTRRASEEARTMMIATLAERHRVAFRGRVAVRLDVALRPADAELGLRRVAKEYIDLMRGMVYSDDAVIDHVEVHRRRAARDRTLAVIRCFPLVVFNADFDRAFRVWDELGFQAPDRGWGRHVDDDDRELLAHDESVLGIILDINAEEEEQLAEDPDAAVDLDIPGAMIELRDWEVRDSAREHLIGSIARSRGTWLCDQGVDFRDRPGPRPHWAVEAQGLDTHDIVGLRDTGPGCFVVPAPPRRPRGQGEPTWDDRVRDAITHQLERDQMNDVRFEGAVALDIAFRAGSGDHADLDNLSHRVIGAMQKALPASTPGIAGYRAYRLEGDTPDVRVRLLPQRRLLALGRAMNRARGLVRAERGRRARANT
jgi:hypothetical protein